MNKIHETDGIIAFVDLLGAKNMIMNDSSEEVLNHLNYIYSLTDYICSNFYFMDVKMSTFSDNFVISIPIENDLEADHNSVQFLITLLAIIQLQMLHEYGYLLRGGICEGKYYHDNNIVWGEALVNAYKLEEKSEYPRIILDKSHYFSKMIDNLNEDDSTFSFINCDVDDYQFIDYLNECLYDYFALLDHTIDFDKNKIKKHIMENLDKYDDSINKKWKWVNDKFLKTMG